MRLVIFLVQIFFICMLTTRAQTPISQKLDLENAEVKILELKLKKQLGDKNLSAHKKYTLAILAARELRQLSYPKKSIQFYQLAKEMKTEENKKEIEMALFPKKYSSRSIFFFDANLKSLIKNRSFEKAILSINPEMLKEPEFAKYRIVYDLLNVKIKKQLVKNLYCYQDYQKDPETYYQYSNLICDLLIDYLREGKLGNDHVKVVEEYFFKHDLKERYLLQLAKDLKPIH